MITHRVIQGDVLDGLRTLPDGCVQCCVTSPPYFNLRNYQTGKWEGGDPTCEHESDGRYYTERGASAASQEAFSEPGESNAKRIKKARWREKGTCIKCGAVYSDNQIGLEETPEQFIQKIVEVFREVRRVLREDGVLWLNFGDSYAGSGKGPTGYNGLQNAEKRMGFDKSDSNRGSQKCNLNGGAIPAGLKSKDLMMIPQRIALAMQADGWYLRSQIPWIKRNCMPESTTDRPTSAIEYVFLMTKSAKYFYDGEAIRVPSSESYQNDARPQGVLRQRVNKNSKYPNEGQFKRIDPEFEVVGGLNVAVPKKQDQTGNPTYTGFNERWKEKTKEQAAYGPARDGFNRAGDRNGDQATRNYRNSDPFFESWQGLYSESENPLAFVINPQSRPELHFACVDDQTEALTPAGWRNIHGLKDHDQIVAFDGVNLSWQEATFHRYPFSGKMVTVNSRDVSMWLTPNHRVVCRDYQDKGDWKIKRADRLKGYEEIPTAAPFDCDTTGELINKEVAELAGWVLTDGSYNKGNTISLYQTGGRGKHEKIESLFDALKIKYSLYQRDRGHGDERSYNFSGEVADFIKKVFPLKEGNFGILATWNERDLHSLWIGMTEGDGSQRKDGRITFVGNRSKVDFYQALCIRLGMTCRASPKSDTGNSFAAFVSKKKTTSLRGTNGVHNIVKQDCYYDGIVWCPSVRSGMWLARRNGRPFITGNTFPDLLAATCIKAGTSERGCCPKCGAPYQRIVETSGGTTGKSWHPHADDETAGQIGGMPTKGYKRESKGWKPGCKCGCEDIAPCVVLDPFMGSGTVAYVARELNRSSIGCELNPEYVKIIRSRLQADSQLDTGVVSYRFEQVEKQNLTGEQ